MYKIPRLVLERVAEVTICRMISLMYYIAKFIVYKLINKSHYLCLYSIFRKLVSE